MRLRSISSASQVRPLRLLATAGAGSLAPLRRRHALRLALILASMAVVPALGSSAVQAGRPTCGQAYVSWQVPR